MQLFFNLGNSKLVLFLNSIYNISNSFVLIYKIFNTNCFCAYS